jgi:hypothetical protein
MLTPYGSSTPVSFEGGGCGGGNISTTVFTGASDQFWAFEISGIDPPAGTPTTSLPGAG